MIRPETYKTDEAFAQAIADEYERRRKYMEAVYHWGWKLDYHFFRGEQYLQAARTATNNYLRMVKPGRNWQVTTVNRIRQHITRVGAPLRQNKPATVCVPVSASPEDEAAGRMADHLTEFLWRENRIPYLRRRLAQITPLWGTTFWLNYWESSWCEMAIDVKKEMAAASADGGDLARWQEMLGEADKNGMWRGTLGKPGDAVEPPQMVFLNFGATSDPRTWTDFIIAKMVPIPWFEEHFPDAEVQAASADKAYQVMSSAGAVPRAMIPEDERDNWALLLEYHKQGTKQDPRGKVAYVGGEKPILLESRESDFSDGRLGLHAVYWTEDPQSAYGISLTHELRGPQIAYNNLLTQIMTWCSRMHGRMIGPKDSGIDLTADPLDIHFYNLSPYGAGFNRPALEVVRPPEPSPLILKALEIFKTQMQDSSSEHTTAQAAGQPNVRSAIHHALQGEEDERGRWPVADQLASLERETALNRLLLAKRWPIPVPLRFVGEENRVEVFAFDAANIKDGMDVQVIEAGQSIFSQEAHEERIRKMAGMGLFGNPDPNHPEFGFTAAEILRQLHIKSPTHIKKVVAQSVNLSIEETKHILEKGERVEVQPWQNHPVHRIALAREANQKKYDNVPPERWELLRKHWLQHSTFEEQSLVGQIERLSGENQRLQQQLQGAQREIGTKEIEGDVKQEFAEEVARREASPESMEEFDGGIRFGEGV